MYCAHYEAGLFTFVETLSGSSETVPIGEALESGDEMLPTAPGAPLNTLTIELISLSPTGCSSTDQRVWSRMAGGTGTGYQGGGDQPRQPAWL